MSNESFNINGMNIDLEVLIRTVQNYPLLWNSTLKGYKSTNVTNKMWKEVAVLLGFQEKDINDTIIKELKKLFKAQKDKYRIEYRKVLNDTLHSGDNSGDNGLSGYESKWPYYSLCEFLNDVVAPNGNAEEETIIEETIESELEPETEVTIRPYKRTSKIDDNMEQIMEFEKKKMNVIENLIEDSNKEQNPDLLFLSSLLPYFNDLDVIENIELKSDIMKCIMNFHKKRGVL